MSIDEKYSGECLAAGFEYLWKGSRKGYSVVKCNVCGAEGEYHQSAIRAGNVRCKACHETKMKQECLEQGFDWLKKVDGHNSLCRCLTCGHEDTFVQGAMRDGKVKCSNCQLTKYQQAAKNGWTFITHFRKNNQTYANLKHSCSDELVKVHSGAYLKGVYDCPHCMHTHFNDASYFYVIQVEDIIKLGISNRPAQRYTQYGLPDDSIIIEHLLIPLETKRDALVVESYAKQLVKDYKLPTDEARQVFTHSGYSECYPMESLELLLTI